MPSTSRKQLSETLRRLRKTFKGEGNTSSATLANIDSFFAVMGEVEKSSRRKSQEYLRDELLAVGLFIGSVCSICLAVDEEMGPGLLPKDWLHETNIPNPDFVLQNFL